MGVGVIRIQDQDASHGALLSIPVLLTFINVAEGEMGLRQALVNGQRLERCLLGFIGPDRVLIPASKEKKSVANSKAGVSQRIVLIQLEGFQVHLDGRSVSRFCVLIEEMPAAGVVVVGLDALRWDGRQLDLLGLREVYPENLRNPLGDLVLDLEDVIQVAIVNFRTEVKAVRGVDELGCDPDAIAALSDGAL